MSLIRVFKMGLTEYGQAYKFQEKLLEQRIRGEIPDTLLLLEHPPTLTIGKGQDLENLLVSSEELKKRGISLFPTDRGGSITWHGPGQIVGYLIFDIKQRNRDIRKFINDLEEVIIRTLADLSIQAGRDERHVGVWVGQEKIAAIGVKVRRWVTKHGFALNVNNDLSHFSLINPCGITNKGVTSVAKLLYRNVPMENVINRLLINFSDVFDAELKMVPEIM